MIHYLATARHLRGIRNYLEHDGAELARQIRLLSFESWFSKRNTPSGVLVLTDLERLSIQELKLAAERLHCRSTQPGNSLVLNHPLKYQRRYELLRNLYEQGINNFNVYRQCENRTPTHFPVFVRNENDHTWDTHELFQTNSDLKRYFATRAKQKLCREDTLISEFCDTADENGIYRKYAAFIVGDRIIPRHLIFRSNWMVKRPSIYDEALMEEELNYVKSNPHEALLRPIFELAGANYGRIDYAFSNGKLQVWEINSNPSISIFSQQILDDDPRRYRRLEAHKIFAKRFNDALWQLIAISKQATESDSLYSKLGNAFQQAIGARHLRKRSESC